MLDFIGIGLGPFNLSLASLLHEKSELSYLFFEKKAQFDWHAGMQLPNTVLQVPFMADLVSMVDPTNPFSFLNYLKHHQRLYKFYFLEQPHIPRREYNHYCQWVADQLQQIQYQSNVMSIYPRDVGFEVLVEQAGMIHRYRCRHLVIGSGNVPQMPHCLNEMRGQYPERCIHSAEYMNHRHDELSGNVVVLGSGQSAAEVFQDLLDRQFANDSEHIPYELHWLTRSQGFFPMEYAPLGLEHFSPDYVEHFYQLNDATKQQQLKQQSLLYKGISARTIQEIYQTLYHTSIGQSRMHTHLHQHCELVDAQALDSQTIRLQFKHKLTQQAFYIDANHVVAATGYHSPQFDYLRPLEEFIERTVHGHWCISQNYQLHHRARGQIFVQNQEMHSHGVVTPDLGMGAFRASIIANQLLGYELYEQSLLQQCFQHFEVSNNPHVQLIKSELDTLSSSKQSNKQQSTSFQYSRASQNHSIAPKTCYENSI